MVFNLSSYDVLFLSAQGDKKRATTRLRGGTHFKSHHFNTFRSGFLLGLAVPALASGLVNGR